MIENFKDLEVRQSGVIYQSTFEQIKKLHAVDPEKAGELAISAIEMVLCGQISSDDMIVELMLEPTKVVAGKDHVKYDQKVETQRQKKILDQKLDQIADLHLRGMRQREIAERLGLTQQIVSYRLGVIRSTYPELLQKDSQNLQTNLPNNYKNTNDTKVTKNTKVCTDGEFGKIGEVCKVDETSALVDGQKPWNF